MSQSWRRIALNAVECEGDFILEALRPLNRAERALLSTKCLNVVHVRSHDHPSYKMDL
jgi:hypothetical protein